MIHNWVLGFNNILQMVNHSQIEQEYAENFSKYLLEPKCCASISIFFMYDFISSYIIYRVGHGLNHSISAQLVQPRFQRLSPPAGQFICSLYTTCGRVRQRGTMAGSALGVPKAHFANRKSTKSTTWGIYREYGVLFFGAFLRQIKVWEVENSESF
jgi:hypothetical protein